MDKWPKRTHLLSTVLGAAVMFCSATSASAVTISKSVGVEIGTAPDGSRAAYTFVVGGDGSLYLDIYSDSTQYNSWSSQGVPPSGAGLSIPVGVTGGPLAFITGTDGNVYARQYYNGGWLWLNTGAPGGVGLMAGIGATTNGGGNPMAFLRGSDGNVWQDYWNGSSWVWYNLGNPGVTLNSVVGVTENGSGHPYVFFVGSDANLWQLFYNGASWVWNSLGQPSVNGASYAVTGAVGATTQIGSSSAYDAPLAIVTTSGGIWEDLWDPVDAVWIWKNLVPPGAPPTVAMPVGAAVNLSSNGPNTWYPYFDIISNGVGVNDLFVGQQSWAPPYAWSVNNYGSLPMTPAIAVGVRYADSGDALLVGTDGNLWVSIGPGPTDWVNLGAPAGGGGGGGGGGGHCNPRCP